MSSRFGRHEILPSCTNSLNRRALESPTRHEICQEQAVLAAPIGKSLHLFFVSRMRDVATPAQHGLRCNNTRSILLHLLPDPLAHDRAEAPANLLRRVAQRIELH